MSELKKLNLIYQPSHQKVINAFSQNPEDKVVWVYTRYKYDDTQNKKYIIKIYAKKTGPNETDYEFIQYYDVEPI